MVAGATSNSRPSWNRHRAGEEQGQNTIRLTATAASTARRPLLTTPGQRAPVASGSRHWEVP